MAGLPGQLVKSTGAVQWRARVLVWEGWQMGRNVTWGLLHAIVPLFPDAALARLLMTEDDGVMRRRMLASSRHTQSGELATMFVSSQSGANQEADTPP